MATFANYRGAKYDDAIKDFDYRRVYARGKFRHDQEMLLGPRLHDGEDGYIVITPLERRDEFPGAKAKTGCGLSIGGLSKMNGWRRSNGLHILVAAPDQPILSVDVTKDSLACRA